MRASVPPASARDLADHLSAAGAMCVSLPTTGLVLAEMTSGIEAAVSAIEPARAAAVAAGGSLVVTSAPVEVKQRIDVWGDQGEALPLMRALKHQFDPKGTLNPGRFVGGI
jgi:glycolate oxidase FAD binding subunit